VHRSCSLESHETCADQRKHVRVIWGVLHSDCPGLKLTTWGAKTTDKVSGEPETTSRRNGAEPDQWLEWLLPVVAVMLPVIVLLVAYSIPEGKISGHDVDVSMGRGDFLIPVLILCVEAIRRWWQNVDCKTRTLRWSRTAVTMICSLSALVALIATTTAASIAISAKAGHFISVITVLSFVIAFSFGTAAVVLSKVRSGADG
jgi:fumarate reductase subunit D